MAILSPKLGKGLGNFIVGQELENMQIISFEISYILTLTSPEEANKREILIKETSSELFERKLKRNSVKLAIKVKAFSKESNNFRVDSSALFRQAGNELIKPVLSKEPEDPSDVLIEDNILVLNENILLEPWIVVLWTRSCNCTDSLLSWYTCSSKANRSALCILQYPLLRYQDDIVLVFQHLPIVFACGLQMEFKFAWLLVSCAESTSYKLLEGSDYSLVNHIFAMLKTWTTRTCSIKRMLMAVQDCLTILLVWSCGLSKLSNLGCWCVFRLLITEEFLSLLLVCLVFHCLGSRPNGPFDKEIVFLVILNIFIGLKDSLSDLSESRFHSLGMKRDSDVISLCVKFCLK
ncbi:unnamed protein product [Moneuplotes crassus]|uniref:Uncharacterized protein n=1 Tax=Euplotes crassus TaxID=5936 RepID=A0AAD1Y3K4_EUPCR|nr:unnamed protein product [Moneuplotes crassus]